MAHAQPITGMCCTVGIIIYYCIHNEERSRNLGTPVSCAPYAVLYQPFSNFKAFLTITTFTQTNNSEWPRPSHPRSDRLIFNLATIATTVPALPWKCARLHQTNARTRGRHRGYGHNLRKERNHGIIAPLSRGSDSRAFHQDVFRAQLWAASTVCGRTSSTSSVVRPSETGMQYCKNVTRVLILVYNITVRE